MKANRLEQVLNSLNPDWGAIDFNHEINEAESGMYHILVVNRLHIQEEQKYVTDVKVVKYHEVTYKTQKDYFAKIGMNNTFILHDPTIKVEKPKAKVEESAVAPEVKKPARRGRKPKTEE